LTHHFSEEPTVPLLQRDPRILRLLLACATSLLVAIAAAQAGVKLESGWLDGEVIVDGSVAEWKDVMTYIEGEALSLGVLNDGERLYLSLLSRDPRFIGKALAMGLKLRLDPKGGEPITIRFPVGALGEGRPPRPGEGPPDMEELQKISQERLDTFLLLGPGREERQELPAENNLGIELRARIFEGEFVYELAVPLERTASRPYAVGAEPGARITLLLETPGPDRSQMRDRTGGPPGGIGRGKRGGMMPGGGRGGPGGRGGLMGGRGPQMPEPVRVKAKVRLSGGPVDAAQSAP
jgi:hypothetical protein